MRRWCSLVLGGAFVFACGGTDELITGTNPDSSAGTGASGGGAGSAGRAGSDAASGSGGTGGSGGSGGEGGVTDSSTDSTVSDASDDSPSDGSTGDTSGGSGGDAGDAAGGGVGIGGPGQVVCGNTACDRPLEQCCLGFPIFGCQPVFPPVCLVSAQLNCDDALDCESGQTCCATLSAGGDITSSNCVTSCDNGVVVCNDSTRCPSGSTCGPFNRLEHYRICAP